MGGGPLIAGLSAVAVESLGPLTTVPGELSSASAEPAVGTDALDGPRHADTANSAATNASGKLGSVEDLSDDTAHRHTVPRIGNDRIGLKRVVYPRVVQPGSSFSVAFGASANLVPPDLKDTGSVCCTSVDFARRPRRLPRVHFAVWRQQQRKLGRCPE